MLHCAPSPMTMLADLIALPSMSSVTPSFDTSNRAVIERLAEWLEGEGFAVEVLPLPEYPEKANLIATKGTGAGGLVLAGHTDTVPCDEHLWNHDPFRLTEKNGHLYGLGTCDMKGFFPLAIEAARTFDAASLRQPLIILATADEESSMEGARQLAKLGRPQARYAVIGEPTGLRPVNAHKGILMEAIHVQGHAGHSSDPTLGNSAIEGMHCVISSILAWREALQREHRDHKFTVPFPTLNLGHIQGGDNPNRICGECELHIDLRPLPGMDPETLRASLRQSVETALAESDLRFSIRPLFGGVGALETPPNSPLVDAAERLTGHSVEAVAFCTEGPFLQTLGMETIILGPGDIAQAHQPDEYIALDRLQPTIDLLRQLISRFCL